MNDDTEYTYTEVNIEDEMMQSYLDYAMSVIVGRALPDVRDGLKPVHRRILYAMYEMGNDWNKKYQKSSRVAGEVMGKYHPHGQDAIYDAMVRMAQDFSQHSVLIDGQGNFGSVDGDAAAAARYTEVRLARIAHELLQDIDKETVDFVPNYDGVEQEPCVLPSAFPNALVNGSSGIAVGMATNVPPHNLTEVLAACFLLLDNPEASIDELIACMPGPDFPTAGIISGVAGIHQAYHSGHGKIHVRARYHVESNADKESIIITELPYQVNKASLLIRLAELVKQKKIEGIRDLRDESDREGMRMVIELRRGENAEVMVNNLYTHTDLEISFGINLVMLSGGRPRRLNLQEILVAFLSHRREVVTRRTVYQLRKARERAHTLEGLAIALVNIDDMVELIRRAATPAEAKQGLLQRAWPAGMVVAMLQQAGDISTQPEGADSDRSELGLLADSDQYRLSAKQAQAILELRLQKLTGLEREKIIREFEELLQKMAALQHILSDTKRLNEVVREELQTISTDYPDKRKTEIIQTHEDLQTADLITEEEMVVTLSYEGYVKAQPLQVYRSQHRGGRGSTATTTKEEDFVKRLYVASTHDTVMCFSSYGRVYWKYVYELPRTGRYARGQHMINLLRLEKEERIDAMLAIREYSADHYLLMVTAQGLVKRTPLENYARRRNSGKRALTLREGDRLISVKLTDGKQDIMLFSDAGKAIRFHETAVRCVGNMAKGVRGMRLGKGQRLVSAIIVTPDQQILTVAENGYGKRTQPDEYRVQHRGGRGVIAIRSSVRNGKLAGAIAVQEGDEVMLITDQGTLIRSPVTGIRSAGRNSQGVRVLRIAANEKLIAIARVADMGVADVAEAEFVADEEQTTVADDEAQENQDMTDSTKE